MNSGIAPDGARSGIETAHEDPGFVFDPFVEVAYHVRDAVVSPAANTTGRCSGGSEYRIRPIFDYQIEPWIEVAE